MNGRGVHPILRFIGFLFLSVVAVATVGVVLSVFLGVFLITAIVRLIPFLVAATLLVGAFNWVRALMVEHKVKRLLDSIRNKEVLTHDEFVEIVRKLSELDVPFLNELDMKLVMCEKCMKTIPIGLLREDFGAYEVYVKTGLCPECYLKKACEWRKDLKSWYGEL